MLPLWKCSVRIAIVKTIRKHYTSRASCAGMTLHEWFRLQDTPHGNGFPVCPSKEKGGQVLSSPHLKILRHGTEDPALFVAVKARNDRKTAGVLSLTLDVCIHPHCYDNLPETLLNKREDMLRRLTK